MSRVISVRHALVASILNKLTNPTVTKADPVFHPTRENWFDNQYSGRLYLRSVRSEIILSVPPRHIPSPSPVLYRCGLEILVRPFRITNRGVSIVAFGCLDELDEGFF